MTIEKTKEIKPQNKIVMIIYGRGGTGKTTFAATAPKPLMLDFENGSKYLGQRGFDIDVIRFEKWITQEEKIELKGMIDNYETIIIDPLGEAMEKLIDCNEISDKKYRQTNGDLTMAGWGEVKKQMRNFIKFLRSTFKNIIIVSHVCETQVEGGFHRGIQVATKLKDELPNMVDVISYLGIGEKSKRILYTPTQSEQFDSKDRTGYVPERVEVSEKDGWKDFVSNFNELPI